MECRDTRLEVEEVVEVRYDTGIMDIMLVTTKDQWKKGDTGDAQAEFLQSFEYGECLKSSLREVGRIQMKEENQLHNLQYISQRLPFGFHYIYIPRAVVSRAEIETCIGFAREKRVSFIRLESLTHIPLEGLLFYPVENRQPQYSWVVSLTSPTEELLDAMHEKTRYNIRLAERKGVAVKQEKNMNVFWALHEETFSRHELKSYPKSYFEALLDLPSVIQLNAYSAEKPIATVLLLHHSRRMTYLFGASSYVDRQFMAPYLMQWHAMQYARGHGCIEYDFWGIARPSDQEHETEKTSCFNGFCWEKKHRFNGITRFKVGFGGALRSYPQAVDIVLNPLMYRVYRMMRREIKR